MIISRAVQQRLNPLFSCDQGSDSPSSSTPEEADTEDDGQAVSIRSVYIRQGGDVFTRVRLLVGCLVCQQA